VGDGRVHADAADPFAGDGFLEFLVGASGREILEQNGFEAP
jgi:ABC-type molybdate transport system substrate-binding protein